MTTRPPATPLSLRPRRLRTGASLTLLAALIAGVPPAHGQMIQVKTIPIADGEQWRFFPSANIGLGGVSIAMRDSLLDPFVNPAKGSRVSTRTKGYVFGSPSFYSVSKNSGGGRTLPIGGIGRMGSTFGGFTLAVQQIDDARQNVPTLGPTFDIINTNSVALPPPQKFSRRNQFAFATLGRAFERAGVSVGASAMWSGLNHIDGVDLLYAGSRSIDQNGTAKNLRLGLLKEWAGDREFEALALYDDFNMSHNVEWADSFWDPGRRAIIQQSRMERNLDHTKVWGMQLGYSQPLADSGWRIGTSLTTNLMSHPKLPEYQLAQVMTIPRDPGRTGAYDIGVGIAKTKGLTRFGIDAVYEPISSHTWGESPDSIVTPFGTRGPGAKTTENWFKFSNAILRTGFGHEIPLDSLRVSLRSLRFEAGVALRSISYTLNQTDHVARIDRSQEESWMEWTRTWGLGFRFTDLEVRYTGRTTTGTGRPGIFDDGNGGVFLAAADAASGRNILSAPNGPVTLTGVAVTTHQLSVSLPIR